MNSELKLYTNYTQLENLDFFSSSSFNFNIEQTKKVEEQRTQKETFTTLQ